MNFPLSLASFVALLCACSSPTPPGFTYAACASTSAIATCPAVGSAPLMVGTKETLLVAAGELPPLTISGSDPNVLGVEPDLASTSCCTNGACIAFEPAKGCDGVASLEIDVRALAAGTADVRLSSLDGSLVGAVSLTAAAPAQLDITCSYGNGAAGAMPTSLASGESCVLGWKATDARGDALVATSGLVFSSSDEAVVGFVPQLDFSRQVPPEAAAEASQAGLAASDLVATGPGDAVVTVRTIGTALTFPVHVEQP